jgi:hypothetical protein
MPRLLMPMLSGKENAPGIVVLQEWWGVDYEIKNHVIHIFRTCTTGKWSVSVGYFKFCWLFEKPMKKILLPAARMGRRKI